MAEDMEVSPRDKPRSHRRDDDYDDEHRIHAPGGSVVVTVPIVMPGGGGERGDRREERRESEPVPATLPLTGNELIDLRAPVSVRPWWMRVYITIIDLIHQVFPPSYSWSVLNAKADQPLTQLCVTPGRDMVWRLILSVAAKTTDGGASSATALLTFFSLDATAPLTAPVVLGSAGPGTTVAADVLIPAGSSINFSCLGGGTYGAASYVMIVSAIPLCSASVIQRADNLLV